MTLLDVMQQFRFWKKNPPLRVLVSGISQALGVKVDVQDTDPKKYLNAEEFERMCRYTGGVLMG